MIYKILFASQFPFFVMSCVFSHDGFMVLGVGGVIVVCLVVCVVFCPCCVNVCVSLQ